MQNEQKAILIGAFIGLLLGGLVGSAVAGGWGGIAGSIIGAVIGGLTLGVLNLGARQIEFPEERTDKEDAAPPAGDP